MAETDPVMLLVLVADHAQVEIVHRVVKVDLQSVHLAQVVVEGNLVRREALVRSSLVDKSVKVADVVQVLQ